MQLAGIDLALNPSASIAVHGAPAAPVFLVRAPVKAVALSSVLVKASNFPDAHAFLCAALIHRHSDPPLSAQGIAELRQIGLFAPSDGLPMAAAYPLPLLASTADAAALDNAETRAHFAREGFATMQNLLPAAHVAALGHYFRELAAEGFLARDDAGGTRRFVAHNHPVAAFWHQQLNERVTQLVAQCSKPSYSFVSVYDEGGDLYWHVDRPPCEYTITLLVDYAPLDAKQRSPWALNIRGRDGRLHAVHQRLGEALIFKGRELRHSRELLPRGHRSTSILFHFVDADYQGEMT